MKNLRQIREAKNLTREELAELTGLSFTTIRAQELGLVNGTETATAKALSAALEVPMQSLFFDANTEISVNPQSQAEVSA